MNVISALSFAVYIALACRLSIADDTNTSCTRKDGLSGNCKHIEDCPKINEIIIRMDAKKSVSDAETEYLSNSDCPIEKENFKCCEEDKVSDGIKILLNQKCGFFRRLKKTIGGYEVSLMSRPWMALLKFKKDDTEAFTCGGTLITSRFVLTAAHCFNNQELIVVRLGEHQISSEIDCLLTTKKRKICAPTVQDVSFDQKLVHKDYSIITGENDIALVKLSQEVKFKAIIRPICLPLNATLQNFKTADELMVTGWGKNEAHRQSDILRETQVPYRDRSSCSNYFKREIKSSQICAGNSTRDSCNGDSGGPLAVLAIYNESQRFVQVGIVSYGSHVCGHAPGVYTNVGSFINWIAEKIAEN